MDAIDISNHTVIDNTSISELNKSWVKLFPNPFNDFITVKTDLQQKLKNRT